MRQVRSLLFGVMLFSFAGLGCEGCEIQENSKSLSLPFVENFDRETLGPMWSSEMAGRWRVQYDARTRQGRLCVEQARNNPLFLRGALPRDVVVEFDAYAQEKDGDVKVELFTDGRFHATGYVLVHGGWHNAMSIIDRLGEHNRDCKADEQTKTVNCRRWTRRNKVAIKQRHHWKVIRHNNKILWYLDGKLHMRYDDPQPLDGKSHRFFAFSNWIAHVCFDNLNIRAYTPNASRQNKATSATPTQVVPKAPTPKEDAPVPPTPAPAQTTQSAPRLFLAPSAVRSRPLLVPAQPLRVQRRGPQMLRIQPNHLKNFGIKRLSSPLPVRSSLQVKQVKANP